jgi:hypothetical protein
MYRHPEIPGGGRDPFSHPTNKERQVKARLHKLPTSHEEATSYATTKPDDDEVTTHKRLDRLRAQDDQADQDGPRRSTGED